MLERNSSAALGGFFLAGLVTFAANSAFSPQHMSMPADVGPMKLPQRDRLGHEFSDFLGGNVASVHWVGQVSSSDAVRELESSMDSFFSGFEDGSIFDLGAEASAAADRLIALYPNLFKATA